VHHGHLYVVPLLTNLMSVFAKA